MDYRFEGNRDISERIVNFGAVLLAATLSATALGHAAGVQSNEVEVNNFLQTMKKIGKDIELSDVSSISQELGIQFEPRKIDTGPNPEITLINYLPEGRPKLHILVDTEFRYQVRSDAKSPKVSATILFGVDLNKLCITNEAMEKVFGAGYPYVPLPSQGGNAVAKETDYAGFTYVFRRPQSEEVRFLVRFDWQKCLRRVGFTNS